jgi:two-component system KDP operon response regulator KdpE
MHGRRVLVIDDDSNTIELIKDILTAEGATVDAALDAEQGLRLFRTRPYDLVLLDVQIPGVDGWQVCKILRDLSDVPIIMLTAQSGAVEEVRDLAAGASDYLAKPFSPKVLLARTQAALQGTEPSPGRRGRGALTYQDEHLAIDLAKRQVSVRGRPVELTRTEYNVLELLVRHTDRLMTSQQLLEGVWGSRYPDRVVYVHVYLHRLRQKLEPDPQNPRYLLNIPGAGYQFHPPHGEEPRS